MLRSCVGRRHSLCVPPYLHAFYLLCVAPSRFCTQHLLLDLSPSPFVVLAHDTPSYPTPFAPPMPTQIHPVLGVRAPCCALCHPSTTDAPTTTLDPSSAHRGQQSRARSWCCDCGWPSLGVPIVVKQPGVLRALPRRGGRGVVGGDHRGRSCIHPVSSRHRGLPSSIH